MTSCHYTSYGPDTAPGCKVFHSTTQSITTATDTAASMNSEEYDTDGYHDISTNNSRITIPTAALSGFYVVSGSTAFASNATGQRTWKIWKNGADIQGAALNHPTVSGVIMAGSVTAILYLAVGDYVELAVRQNSGGNLNIGDGANNFNQSAFSAVKIGN